MPMPEELKKTVLATLEKHYEEVRSCPMTPGSLEPRLIDAAEDMGCVTQRVLIQTASDEADFPPSGVSSLRCGETLLPGREATPGRDDIG